MIFGHTWSDRKSCGNGFTSVPALRCIAPLPGVLQPVRRALVDSNRLLLYEYSPPSQSVHSRRRIILNAGLVGNCSPIPKISTRPDPPPASKWCSGSYEEVGVRLGILGNYWGLSFSTRAMRACHRAERVPHFGSSRKRERDPQDPQSDHMLLCLQGLASGDLARTRSPPIPKIPITATGRRRGGNR